MATTVKRKAEMKAGLSPKFSIPIARAPRMTVKFSHDKKVRSLAKKTLGSTRVGSAIRLPLNDISFNRIEGGVPKSGKYIYLELSGGEVGWTWLIDLHELPNREG